MQKTPNFNLNLPEGPDRVDVEAINENSEVIDLVMAQIRSKAEAPVYYNQVLNTPSSLPASDVYPWAKQATKPTYSPSEIGTMSTTDITQITDDLDDRVTAIEEGSVNVETITPEQIKSLFDNPVDANGEEEPSI